MYSKLLVALEQNKIPKEVFLREMNVGEDFTEQEFAEMLQLEDLTVGELSKIANLAGLTEKQAVEVFF